MKLPDTDHLIICRVELTDLMASRSSGAETFIRAGAFFERIKQQGFNAVAIECKELNERMLESSEDGLAGDVLANDNRIRDVVGCAQRLELSVVLIVENRLAGAASSAPGAPAVLDWQRQAEAMLTMNQKTCGADGIWFRTAGQAGRHSAHGVNSEQQHELPDEWQAVAGRYPDTLLIVDMELVGSPGHRTEPHQPPNLIIRNPLLDGLLANWQQGGPETIENLDELAAALIGDEPALHEDMEQAVSEPAPGRRRNFIVNAPRQAGLGQTPQSIAMDRVLTALVLSGPGIPVLGWNSSGSSLAALLRLRQGQDASNGGLQGNHIRIIHKNDAGKVLGYLRWSRDARQDGVMVLINLNGEGWRDYTLGLPMDSNWQLQLHSDASDSEEPSLQFSEEQYFPEPASLTLDLPPYSFLVFTRAG